MNARTCTGISLALRVRCLQRVKCLRIQCLYSSFAPSVNPRVYRCLSSNGSIRLLSGRNAANNSPFFSSECKSRNRDIALYGTAFALFTFAVSYASVPLYRIYCQSTGKGGRATHVQNDDKVKNMQPVVNRPITVKFTADVSSQMAWNFKPSQSEVKVHPGETVLAFYTAKNPLDIPVNGVATYNVLPFEAGQYLNKIQCFCFEEQRLNPNEEVDLPIFFYFDPEYVEDPRLESVREVVLSYTFFETKEGIKLPFISSSTTAVKT